MSFANPTLDAPPAPLTGKYLAFALGRQEFGLPILKVREVISCVDVIPMPNTPPFVKGVINLRGQVIAIMDLRAKLGMPVAERTDKTSIIVVEIHRRGVPWSAGLIVDSVSEAFTLSADAIEPAPAFSDDLPSSSLLGTAKVGNSITSLLNIDAVFGDGARPRSAR